MKHSFNRGVLPSSRRRKVIERLKDQLIKGTKNTKEGVKELSEKDISRINKEIDTLQYRIDNQKL